MSDYPAAQEHLVPRNFMFNSNGHKAIVIHKTAGDATPQAVYDTFLASGNPGKSVHYCVGQDGSIWQYVPEELGAGGNGITDGTMQPFWQPYLSEYGNLNMCTLSVEHCDPSITNQTPLTDAQKQASFALVAYLCEKYGIDGNHIKPHNSIVSTLCPGNYPMQELIDFVNGNVNKGVSWLNVHQEAQALATWNSTTIGTILPGGNDPAPAGILPAGHVPDYGTGIALAWQQEYTAGHNWGPPTSYEYSEVNGVPLTDWEGNPIIQQNFMGGRCEWSNGKANWYPWS